MGKPPDKAMVTKAEQVKRKIISYHAIRLTRRFITRMHGSALRCVRSHSRSMEYGKFDPSVNRKRLKVLRSRLGYIITMRSRVVVQNMTQIG